MSEQSARKAQTHDRDAARDQQAEQQTVQHAVGPYGDVRAMQRAAGNRAMSGLLGTGGADGSDSDGAARDELAGSGQPLDPATRADMEARFGEDFGSVRVHADRGAARSAEALGANAYTSGEHVVFGPNLFAPELAGGKRLLAHELGHVVQQRRAAGRGPAAGLASSEGRAESEARQVGTQASAGQAVSVQSSGAGIQLDRKDDDDPVLRAFMQQQQQKANPATGSAEWFRQYHAAHGGVPPAWARQPAATPTPATGDDRAHMSPPGPKTTQDLMKQPLLDVKKAQELAAATKERAEKEAAEKERQAVAARQQALEKVFGKAGPSEKREEMRGSPLLALHEAAERAGFGAAKDMGPLQAAVLSMPKDQFIKQFPKFSENQYYLLRDYFSIGSRPPESYRPPDAAADASLRKILGVGPNDYIPQARLDALITPLAYDQTKAEIKQKSGASDDDIKRVYQYLQHTGRRAESIDKDPVVAVPGFIAIRESQLRALQFQQRMEDLRMLEENTFAAIGYGAAIVATDDHETAMNVARVTGAAGNVLGAVAATKAGQDQMQAAGQSASTFNDVVDVAPSNAQRPPLSITRPSTTQNQPTQQTAPPATTSVPKNAASSPTVNLPRSDVRVTFTPPPQTGQAGASTMADQPKSATTPQDTQPKVYGPAPTDNPSFGKVQQDIEKVEAGKGPVVGQNLGKPSSGATASSTAPTGTVRPQRTAEDLAKEAALVKRMGEERLAEGMNRMSDLEKSRKLPGLRAAVESNTTVMGDGKTTLKELAADSPELVADAWQAWQAGRASGDIKSADFGQYMKIRQREFRGTYGEYTETFKRGPNEITVKAPKGTTQAGTDMITHNTSTDRTKILDNKAVREGRTVGKVTAEEHNLPQNLDEDIRNIEAYSKQPGVPPEIADTVLPRLKAARADIEAYLKANPGKDLKSAEVQAEFARILNARKIDRVVTTSGAGANVRITGKLGDPAGKGFKQE